MPPVIAIDAMGGDRAPAEIVAGALEAVDACDVDVLLVGPSDILRTHLPDGRVPARVELLDAAEVIGMDEEPAAAVRTKKDSSIVRAAEAVRDGRAAAMVGAGNTGATMAAALLRFGRIKGVHRPAIAIPVPVFGEDRIQLLVDGGATVDPDPEWSWTGPTPSRLRHASASACPNRRSHCCRTAKNPGRVTRCASARPASSPT